MTTPKMEIPNMQKHSKLKALCTTISIDYFFKDMTYDKIVSRYDPETTNNDIALLKLEKKIDFSKYDGTVAPVCLPDAPRKYYDKDVTVSGWGLLEDGGKAANKLMEVDLKVIWMNECRKEFKYDPSWITSRMLCTFAKVSIVNMFQFH